MVCYNKQPVNGWAWEKAKIYPFWTKLFIYSAAMGLRFSVNVLECWNLIYKRLGSEGLIVSNKAGQLLFIYFILPAITALVFLCFIPATGNSAFLFGLAKSWLLVAGILLLLAIGFTGTAILSIKFPAAVQKWLANKIENQNSRNIIVISSGLVFLLCFALYLVPDKYLGKFTLIDDRIRPLVIWLILTSFQVLLGVIAWLIHQRKETGLVQKEKIIIATLSLVVLLMIWSFISLTGLGLLSLNTFWSKIGVPILWPQVLLALGLGLVLQLLFSRPKFLFWKSFWIDFILIALIWVAAVILWNNQPFVQGVFNTPPRPPTYEIYPYNDSLLFDLSAQKMLVGQKMLADVTDKPIYISFLAILHFLAGTSYTSFYFLQILCFAFIPICGYWIGKIMHSRPLGVMLAALLIIKELNSIALTNYIHVSTSKMILSEMLTALGVLLFTLFLLKWLQSKDPFDPSLWIAGGVLGLTCLVRLNAISILPAVILVLGLVGKLSWKRWLTASLILTFFVIISAIPWMIRSNLVSGNPFSFIVNKTSGVIVSQRYAPVVAANPAPDVPVTPSRNYFVIGQRILTNYLHNLVGITLMFSPSLELYNLVDMVRLPYWDLTWTGSLLPGGFWIILGVLGVIAWGLASSWIRWRSGALVPLAVILGYDLTTAVSLTSGGRYLVPMDWGPLLYFSIGLIELASAIMILFGWLRKTDPVDEDSRVSSGFNYWAMLLVGAAFLFAGATPIMLENFPSNPYRIPATVAGFIKANQALPQFSLPGNKNIADYFAEKPGLQIMHGKALYPRYYGENKGDGLPFDVDPLIGSAPFDHLSFLLIGADRDMVVVLPADKNLSDQIPGSDTWVLGCQKGNFFDAKFVVFRQMNFVNVYQALTGDPGCG